MVDALLKILDEQFNRMYSAIGRRSTAPERLLRTPLLQSLYSIRSERALMEHMDFDILFRWFIDLHLDEPVWDHSSFSKNRGRLIFKKMAHEYGESPSPYFNILLDSTVENLLSGEACHVL